jgi:hypothetical protein
MALLLRATSTAAAEMGPAKGVDPLGLSAHGRGKTGDRFPFPRHDFTHGIRSAGGEMPEKKVLERDPMQRGS